MLFIGPVIKVSLVYLRPYYFGHGENEWNELLIGHLAVLAALVSAGANINALTASQSTPLILAAAAGQSEIVAFLLQCTTQKGFCPSPSDDKFNTFQCTVQYCWMRGIEMGKPPSSGLVRPERI